MKKHSYHISVIFLILIVIQLSCLPTTFKSLRLYERKSGDTIYLVLAKPKHNRGVIYTAQSEADKGLEIFDGEYHIHGKNYQPDPRSEEFMNQTLSLAKEYGFGENSNAKPAGTGIVVGSEGTVIEIILYDVERELKSGDGIGRDNYGNFYRVYLSEEEI